MSYCDHQALVAFVRDATAVRHADAAAMAAALVRRTKASTLTQLWLANVDALREQVAALHRARDACGPP